MPDTRLRCSDHGQAGPLRIGGARGETIIADEMPDNGAVLLLDVGIIVLLPRATAGEGNGMPPTVVQERAVSELRAVVTVQTDQRHGQPGPDPLDGPAHAVLALAPDRDQLDPGLAMSTA